MQLGKGLIDEIHIQDERAVHITCAPALIPAPGQYILAQAETDTDSPLPLTIFPSGITAKGFFMAAPTPASWQPGIQLHLRGPLGHGFEIPATAKKIALLDIANKSSSLLALIQIAIKLKKEITYLSQQTQHNLPADIEILSLENLSEATAWADFIAVSLNRDQLISFIQQLPIAVIINTQVLINTDMPCSGLAECGVCAIRTRKNWLMTCKDGPVFWLNSLIN